MKKYILFAFLTCLFIISFICGYFFCSNKLIKKINNIEKEKKDIIEINIKLQNENNKLKIEMENINANKNEKDYTHPIDIEEKNCISQTNSLFYYTCEEKAINAWNSDIEKQLRNIKKIMEKEDFEHINISQIEWEKSIKEDKIIINKFIIERKGLIHNTIGTALITELTKKRSLLLQEIYNNYKEEIELTKDTNKID